MLLFTFRNGFFHDWTKHARGLTWGLIIAFNTGKLDLARLCSDHLLNNRWHDPTQNHVA